MKKSCIYSLLIVVGLLLPSLALGAEGKGEVKPAGFIALSASDMTWDEAKAYCQQQGGKLPLVGGSNSRDRAPKDTHIDGFGAVGAPWPSGMPREVFWTATANTSNPGYSWSAANTDGNISVFFFEQKDKACRAACIP